MYTKLIGAIMVITACGGFGFRLAAAHIREERTLRRLTAILDYMECELQYRLTPLPQLCRQAAGEGRDALCKFFLSLTHELEDQISPDVECCVQNTLKHCKDIPNVTRTILEQFGETLGRFDLQGQIKGLEAVRQECRRNLEIMNQNKEGRLRGYKTLGLCAGAALAILFL